MKFLLIFFTVIDLVSSHISCQHHAPARDDVVFGVPIIEKQRVLHKRGLSREHDLRIHISYDQTLDSLSADKRNLIRLVVLPAAVNFWQTTLQVRSSSRTLRLLRQCQTRSVTYKTNEAHYYCMEGCKNLTKCGEVEVPRDHLMACRTCSQNSRCRTEGENGSGVVNSDFILYVSTKTTERCGMGTTVAYAAYCQLEELLDRPVAGYVNICPQSISTQSHDRQQIIATIKHEILHALGFSAGLFAFYRDGDGSPLTPRNQMTNQPEEYNEVLQLYQWSDRVVRKVIRPQWVVSQGHVKKEIYMMVTPKVVAEVRKHFNCPTLEGAELEDQGFVGTAVTHWEKRVFEHEAMTGTYTQNPVISRITLALMEDTGWYGANYERAEPLDWGRDLGCEFVTRSCMDWMERKRLASESMHPFCDRPRSDKGLRTECTTDLQAVALCNLIEYSAPLPVQYQYMSQLPGVAAQNLDKYAGSVELADYCPYIQEFTWKENGLVVRNSDCRSELRPGVKTQNYALELFGNQSLCLVHASHWSLKKCNLDHELDHWGSGCYKYRCETSIGLIIVVQQTEYVCTGKGQLLSVTQTSPEFLHQGTLRCPDCTQVCGWTCPTGDSFQTGTVKTVDELVVPCGASGRSPVPLSVLGHVVMVVWLLCGGHHTFP